MTTEREAILGRIREALKIAAPVPGQHGEKAHPPEPHHGDAYFEQWLPPVGDTFEARAKLFAENAADLKADFHLLPGRAVLADRLKNLSRDLGWKRAGTHRGKLTDAACAALGLPLLCTDDGYGVMDLESCDVGITGCDALIAQTGSVLVTNHSAGGRALSVLPPHHVVLATRDQLLGDLAEALALVNKRYAPNPPSFMSFITGPSRTGDIERILVLGAHGPKKLTIFCL